MISRIHSELVARWKTARCGRLRSGEPVRRGCAAARRSAEPLRLGMGRGLVTRWRSACVGQSELNRQTMGCQVKVNPGATIAVVQVDSLGEIC